MQITDKQLYNLCKKYGRRARLWRQKFAGLLPEVYKRRLFEKKGYGSIFEFAAKLAGMSQDHVRLVLNLERRFEDKPILKNMLENGEVSVSKMAKVASIATAENQEFLATQIKLLPRAALETLVRDINHEAVHQNALYEPKNECKSVPGNTNWSHNCENVNQHQNQHQDDPYLNTEVRQKLFTLQQKGIDINALLLEFLEKRELEIAQEKERLARKSESPSFAPDNGKAKSHSRHISAEIKNILKQEFGEKCSLPHCMRPAETIHHTQRFALSGNHNPYFLAPLCEEHHAIAHSIDMNLYRHRAPLSLREQRSNLHER